jgi:hypothetical protein
MRFLRSIAATKGENIRIKKCRNLGKIVQSTKRVNVKLSLCLTNYELRHEGVWGIYV